MNTNAMHEVMTRTQTGQMTFKEVVSRLLEVGVESYFVDFAAGKEVFYLSDGQTHEEKMVLPETPVAKDFSSAALQDAIRGAQNDTIRYPEFVKRSTAAGVVGYWAFLAGKRVIYFGRQGESHIELFPGVKS
jgi:uncharacterized protein YbcV (DUF1398 family)